MRIPLSSASRLILESAPSFQSCRAYLLWAAVAFVFVACKVERRKTDAELGLNPQQAAGRRTYDAYCGRCHEPYSPSGKQGPSLQGVFEKPYLSISGLPANDERVGDIVKFGRSKMNGFGQVLNQQQVDDLLAYMQTL